MSSTLLVARFLLFPSAILFLCAATPAQTTHPEPFAKAWHDMAAVDSNAALKLIEENHPGAAPELGDVAFETRLALAQHHVAERLPKVKDFGGYSALMDGLAADFGDGHIWSSAIIKWGVVRWAGIVPAREKGAWFVGAQKAAKDEPDVIGAEIVSCDGEPFDRFARRRIGLFEGNPDVEATLINGAPYLFVDYENPFVSRPNSCVFRQAGREQPLRLTWRRTLPSRITALLKTHVAPSAGLGVTRFSGGFWIALDTLEQPAGKVVDEVADQQKAILAAPMVVIDLRGNGGGDSKYADRLARLLAGNSAVDSAIVPLPSCSGDYWRASPLVLKSAKSALATARQDGDTDDISYWMPVVEGLSRAVAGHQAFWPKLPACASHAVAVDQGAVTKPFPGLAMKGRLVIVTDRSCFSSCLIAVNLFRHLGALQVGETTDMSTRYMEVHEKTMPSGLRTFSTLQKVALGLGDYGPYKPDLIYPGDLTDTNALKTWVYSTVRSSDG